MIVLATNREGVGHPLLKWHRFIANTLLESKIYLKSQNYQTLLTRFAREKANRTF